MNSKSNLSLIINLGYKNASSFYKNYIFILDT